MCRIDAAPSYTARTSAAAHCGTMNHATMRVDAPVVDEVDAEEPPSPHQLRVSAARQVLMSDVLPFQRHEVLGRLSVVRMGLMTLRRKPAADDTVGQLDRQLRDAIVDMRALRWWDRPAGVREHPAEVLASCRAVLAAMLALRGHGLEAFADADLGDEVRRWPAPQSQLALVAVALHAAGRSAQRGQWTVALDGMGVQGSLAPSGDAGLGPALPAPGIERWVAQALVDDAGAHLQLSPGRWRIDF